MQIFLEESPRWRGTCLLWLAARIRFIIGMLAATGLALNAHADSDPVQVSTGNVTTPPAGESTGEAEQFSVHGQFTNVTQKHPPITAPYQGPNSLRASEQAMETGDVTLYVGIKLWSGGELYVNPEIDQGYGLSNTVGIAGFPSGEAYKIGNWTPYYRMQRAFVCQTFALDGAQSKVESAPNALAGNKPDNNVTLTVGKFSVVDIFDTNVYAHDPRADFMNWSIIDSGAFDYAADSWGYTVGAAMEWTQGDWTLRGGYFALSTAPNAETLDTSFRQNSGVAEIERRFKLMGRPGAIRALAFVDRGRIARYEDALALATTTHTVPDVALVRRAGSKAGYAVNLEQEIADGVGMFARTSTDNGKDEAFEFTEINRSVSAGLSFKGNHWGRPGDTFGAAAVINGLSEQARAYFAAGGNGILIGDGRLPHYGNERIFETFYSGHINKSLSIAADFQYIWNPAYNPDRGPVTVYGLRLHAKF
jgi:high affinity Mn2+ porin